MDSYGFLMIPMDSYGFLGIPVGPYGFIWIPVDSYGSILLRICFILIHMDSYGRLPPREELIIFGITVRNNAVGADGERYSIVGHLDFLRFPIDFILIS